MRDLKNSLLEDLSIVKRKIKEYEEKTYTIHDVSAITNDRIEYDRVIGEKRTIELMLMRLDYVLNKEEK